MVNFSIYRLALPIYRLTKFLPIYRLRFPISILKMSIYRLARILSIYRLAIRSGFQSIDFSSNLVSLDKISLSCLQDQTLPPPTTKPQHHKHYNLILWIQTTTIIASILLPQQPISAEPRCNHLANRFVTSSPPEIHTLCLNTHSLQSVGHRRIFRQCF